MSTLEVLILSSNYQARRKIQAGQTERAILAAATELSRERSFEKISVREICQHVHFIITLNPKANYYKRGSPHLIYIWKMFCMDTKMTNQRNVCG